jgi:hypothetical protein
MTDDRPASRSRDRSNALVVTYDRLAQPPYRQVFEPRAADGPDWVRIEEVRADDGTWREVGSEIVADVTLEDRRDD